MKCKYVVRFYVDEEAVEELYFRDKQRAHDVIDFLMFRYFPNCRAEIHDLEDGTVTNLICEREDV